MLRHDSALAQNSRGHWGASVATQPRQHIKLTQSTPGFESVQSFHATWCPSPRCDRRARRNSAGNMPRATLQRGTQQHKSLGRVPPRPRQIACSEATIVAHALADLAVAPVCFNRVCQEATDRAFLVRVYCLRAPD